MKPGLFATSVLLLSLSTPLKMQAEALPVNAHPRKKSDHAAQDKRRPVIRVKRGGWGNAKEEDIEDLLAAVASELLRRFPGRELAPIVVSPSLRGPVVLYQKGPANEYQVHLSARGGRWAEYVYEFSHELLHILANYENHAPPHHARHLWFEEMLGETVSLHMLKRFSREWPDSPPLPQHASYTQTLQQFTDRALSDRRRSLPRNISFEQWFRANGPFLSANPHLREKNDLVAALFLPLLEQAPDWSAIAYLNLDGQHKADSFRDYLLHWHDATPIGHRQLIASAMDLFHFARPMEQADHMAAADNGEAGVAALGIREGRQRQRTQ